MSPCFREDCFAPDSTCALGNPDPQKCPAWKGEAAPNVNPEPGGDHLVMPWSGSALGLVDIGFVAGRSKPVVVGIAGPQNAGKTTLLAAWYLLLGRGLVPGDKRRFAGSYTLSGWEAVANSLRWSPGQPPGFPPHTTSRAGRMPGLLHLAFRDCAARLRSYLFADAPGEWFQSWAVHRDGPEGGGARWVSEYADVLLLVADCEALSGPTLGTARGAFQMLARRVSAERRGRPVGLVWTKADKPVSAEMERSIRAAVFPLMPDALEFRVSIVAEASSGSETGHGLLELLDWTLDAQRLRPSLPDHQAGGTDPLFLFGARTA